MRLFLSILCLSAFFFHVSALSSDGITLLSLLSRWTTVPPPINSSWNAFDSTPCSWDGVQCDHAHNAISLNLSSYGIIGQLGPQIGQLNHLQTLILKANRFSGKIPSELGNCSLLEYLDLSENQFSQQIPYSLNKLKILRHISFSSNLLSGEIPHGIGMLSELEHLELSFNRLTGDIPISIWKIQPLKYILVHNNSLSGELPLEITELKHLENITLFDNQFSGVIPQSLGTNSRLVKLDFMNNKFSGQIPPNLCYGKQLRMLNMGFNQLQGEIPLDVGRCATLVWLNLKGNNLSGPFPDFERNLALEYMDISKNNISGAIPSSLGNSRNLTEINLSANKFTGLLPPELGNLVNLMVLNLADNNLEGPLPPQLSNCTQMDSFDAGFNFLNGSLPSSFKSWTGLTTLILRENHFTGGIPVFLSELDKLRELQLGGNLFGGEIPRSIGASQNLFYGLNLSGNGLTGEVPVEIGKLKRLQSLDVSLNNLTGNTEVFDELPSLLDINISYNAFVGPVPKMLMKFLNSSPSSFLGNPSLCVQCLPSGRLSCVKTHHLKPCDGKPVGSKGIGRVKIVMTILGCSICASLMLVAVLRLYLQNGSEQDFEEQSFSEQRNLGIIGATYKLEVANHKKSSSLLKDVMKATENLNERYIIGRGGHGIVYKVQLQKLPDDIFAMKKIEFRKKKWRKTCMYREIESSRKIKKHKNVVRCEGFWIEKDYGLIFYPYIENGSLHDVLHEMYPPPPLQWNMRYNIALGIAQGLKHLHHNCYPPIVHRDIKPRNILLDPAMEPHISDFGISMDSSRSYPTPVRTQSSFVVGTVGYIAPENPYTIVQRRESDVYSYGVVLLELITRKKVLDPSFMEQTTLVLWVRSVWEETGDIRKIVDPSLAMEFPVADVEEQVLKVLLLALRCTDKDPGHRPTMRAVIKALKEALINALKEPSSTWTPPPTDFIKLNIDCLKDWRETREMSAGGVFRDWQGDWVVGYAKQVGLVEVPLAELWAVFLGLQIASDRNMRLLIIETESPTICRLLISNIYLSITHYDPLIKSCRSLMRGFDICRISYITEESNIWADHMAKLGMQLTNSEISIFDSCPCSAKTCVLRDSQGGCCPSSVVLGPDE